MNRLSLPPSALDRFDEIAERLAAGIPAFFLDFDGTLSPLVERPGDAAPLPAARRAVERLAERLPVAVVSGRDREDVAARLDLPNLTYAGSHGFDVAGAPGTGLRYVVGEEAAPALAAATEDLAAALGGVDGAEIEPKRATVAVHYRRVAAERWPQVEAAVDSAVAAHGLRKGAGKRVWELRPDLDWDKGKAILWLLEAMELGDDAVPLYVGDDVTDEDAFRALPEHGVGIRVASEPVETAAGWSLDGPEEVAELLERLAGVV
ncbi:MAG TPA: trehalose-phosphatase [Thermoanaerobaculia bacterium]|nr:trehalose-phosphatase [Thermoanaerobaculia bacterium]